MRKYNGIKGSGSSSRITKEYNKFRKRKNKMQAASRRKNRKRR